MRRQIVIGNWKMNGSVTANSELLAEILDQWTGVHQAEVAVCPPYPYLAAAAVQLDNSNVGLGAQDISTQSSGAYTGEISGDMLTDVGCRYVLVGHSERREYHGETSELVAEKFQAALDKGLTPVLCVGETLAERENGKTFDVIGQQLLAVVEHCGLPGVAKGIIAYEPVWAIGTGKTATPEMAQDVHSYIREVLGPEGDQMRILYGGSVKPDSAEGLFGQKDIDGALVGGASLKAEDFVAICRAAE
ncbi:triose-phosphate isomerase [Teredinibacter franksiae]|mgnify:CR=1 FL=1|uniref:triose-phosphate isomerase n=1 Tax=Teredinibacter franksiae TaxID=2761453 RepID=UPI0016260650|nr:triose-phosphate isomerase [Teredinibacter franksiae]